MSSPYIAVAVKAARRAASEISRAAAGKVKIIVKDGKRVVANKVIKSGQSVSVTL